MRNRIAACLGLAVVVFWAAPRLIGEAPPRPAPGSSVPRFSHVVIIILENEESASVVGSRLMPNLNRWANEFTLLASYFGVTHPSLPNYLALFSGDFFGIQDDCTDCHVNAPSLPDLLEAAGRTWKGYFEGLPSAGFTGAFAGLYAKKHNPFVYFDPILKDQARLERSVVPIDRLAADLEADALPDFAFVVPDLCNSAHDCGLDVADAWLGRVGKMILESKAFDGSSLLVVTFDEGDTNAGCCGAPATGGGGQVATVLISPLVKKRFKDATPYSHYSLLKTILAAWGLGDLGHTSDPAVVPILKPWRGR